MDSETLLPRGLRDQLDANGPADLVVGIPSFNNARTIPHVVRAVQAGLAKFFPGVRAVILNSDGGSTDGTQEAVQGAPLEDYPLLLAPFPIHPVHRIVTPYHGLPGKGSALRTVFAVADALDAKACAVVDADLRSIQPSWMDLLLAPVLRGGFDFVAPLYLRHKYDGTITNSIVYPLTRSLYGLRVRQPIGGDFGFSGRLARQYLAQDVWESDVARFGIDAWMTTTAITGGFRVCQAFLGAKIHDAKDPAVDLSHMLHQVVGSVFGLMETHAATWQGIQGSRPVPLFGLEHAVGLEPVQANADRMLHLFRKGVRELDGIWRLILNPEDNGQLRRLAAEDAAGFNLPAELWVRLIHTFALRFHAGGMDREHLLQALTPLYLGRVASFVLETRDTGAEGVEEIEEGLCQVFEALKPDLIQAWNEIRRLP